jgi:predicted MFS family arabinose efflux permease
MTAIAKPYRLPLAILIAGAITVLTAMGLRASMGLYLKPMSLDLGWGRETFAFAMALQNLMWGAFQPFAAAISEKWGTGRIVAFGGVLYASGLYIMADVSDPLIFQLSAGLLLGMAQSGCGLAIVLGAVGRALPAEKLSFGLGLVTACGAAGQFTVVPLGQVFLNQYGWSTSYVLLALLALTIIGAAYFLRDGQSSAAPKLDGEQKPELGLVDMLQLASRERSFWLLTAGFFVCGFHVAFIGVHMPAFLSDAGLPPGTGAWSLALIGVFNVLGSFSAGILGNRFPKKYLLCSLYTLRAITITLFISFPITTETVIAFSIAMGVLWLSTVPLTSGLVAVMFGPRYMGTLFAIVFFSHQVGSFMGVWMGGYLYDTTGSYMPVWWAGIVIGLLSALLHLPINERVVPQTAKA